MKRELERAREDTSGAKVYVLATYYFLTSNYSLIVVLFGVLMIVFGRTILSGEPAVLFRVVDAVPLLSISWMQHDVFAGMFGVWGASLVVIGGAAYGVMWANKLYARVTQESETEAEPEPETETETL